MKYLSPWLEATKSSTGRDGREVEKGVLHLGLGLGSGPAPSRGQEINSHPSRKLTLTLTSNFALDPGLPRGLFTALPVGPSSPTQRKC